MSAPPVRRWDALLATLTALGLGAVAAVMLVAGHHPWDGPEVAALFGSHGLHRGDVLAVGPAVAGVVLAAWCFRQQRVYARGARRSGSGEGSR